MTAAVASRASSPTGPPTGTATGLPVGLAEDLAAAALALARRLHAGGTLWCTAPAWPHHAQHVAVEFVHPVIVGKPALPAVAFAGHEPTSTVRAQVRSGDVLLVIGAAAEPSVHDLLRRAPAWGVHTLWIGDGAAPAAGAADHVLWLPADLTAAHDGRFILLYHLLWELTHVCLEHGGLLRAAAPEPVCVTCADEGRLAEVLQVDGPDARVRTAEGVENVDVSLLGAVALHDLIVVHAGMAITHLSTENPQ